MSLISREFYQDKIQEAFDNLDRLLWMDKYIKALESQLDKWETWQPDDEVLAALQEQARSRDGSYTNGLAAQSAYIGGLEGRNRALMDALARTQAALDAAGELLKLSSYIVSESYDGIICGHCQADENSNHETDCEYIKAQARYTAALASARGTETG